MSFDVAEIGNPVLRQHAKPIEDFADPSLPGIITDLMAVMNQRKGVGIAAPQVSLPLQLLIIASAPNARYPDAPRLAPFVMINPEIVSQSEETDIGWEGCLSVPSIRGRVERSTSVEVVFYTETGERKTRQLDGFPARIFLHEYDHLIGLTFLDRVASPKDLVSEKEFLRQFT